LATAFSRYQADRSIKLDVALFGKRKGSLADPRTRRETKQRQRQRVAAEEIARAEFTSSAPPNRVTKRDVARRVREILAKSGVPLGHENEDPKSVEELLRKDHREGIKPLTGDLIWAYFANEYLKD
jgi:hypothetical protein